MNLPTMTPTTAAAMNQQSAKARMVRTVCISQPPTGANNRPGASAAMMIVSECRAPNRIDTCHSPDRSGVTQIDAKSVCSMRGLMAAPGSWVRGIPARRDGA